MVTVATQEQTPIDDVLHARGKVYGSFDGHAQITQGIKREMRLTDGWGRLTDAQREALEMVAHKIGRIINGDADYVDSWTDIVGYARLAQVHTIRRNIDADEV